MEANEHETKIECPHCGQHIIIDKPAKDIKIECPSCLQDFIVFATTQSSSFETRSSFLRKSVNHVWSRIKTQTQITTRFVIDLIKKGFLWLPEWARGSVVTAAVFIFVILTFLKNNNSDYLTATNENDDPRSLTSHSAAIPVGDKTEVDKPVQSLVKIATVREREAMGRVWYSYTYVSTTLKKRMANSANNPGEGMLVNGFGSLAQASLLSKIRTTGCPDDFADSWKSYAQAEAVVLALEGPLFMAETAIENSQRQGQYVDSKTRNDAKELKSSVEKAKHDAEQKRTSFFRVCEQYGGVSVLTEWAMQFRDGLANASEDAIFDEMFEFEN